MNVPAFEAIGTPHLHGVSESPYISVTVVYESLNPPKDGD